MNIDKVIEVAERLVRSECQWCGGKDKPISEIRKDNGLDLANKLISLRDALREKCQKPVKDNTVCDCRFCILDDGKYRYNRHIRVSPTLILNIQYICDSPTGNAGMAIEMDGEIIPKIRELFQFNPE